MQRTGDVVRRARIDDLFDVRDTTWASFTCHIGLPVVGVRPSDGGKVSAADRSPDQRLLALATGKGHVLITANPCVRGDVRRVKEGERVV
jgi:hypothetical protein